MKKIVLCLLAVIMLCVLLGCDSNDVNGGTSSAGSTVTDNSQGADILGGTDSSGSVSSSGKDEIGADSTGTSSSNTDAPGTDIGNGDNTEKDNKFKVYLEYNGAPFKTEEAAPIVVWSDGFSYYEAPVDENGIAYAQGLNGDYVVSLKNVPAGYAYNPNPYDEENKTYGYIVTNDTPETTIELFKVGETSGAGSTVYNRVVITRTGVYNATLNNSDHMIYFEFAPKSSGTYTIESWVPVTDDKVNPKVDVYTSSFAAPIYLYTLDTGGAEGKYYTKNFKYEVEISKEMISSSGGQVVFVFAIYANARNDRYYPASINFAVKYQGGFELEHTESKFMVPNELYGIMAKKISQIKEMSYQEFINDYGSYGVSEIDYEAIQNLSTAKLNDGTMLNHFLNSYPVIREIAISYLHEHFGNYYKDTVGKIWKNPATEIGGSKVLIGKNYKYNEKTGFYHKYDEILYASDPYGYGKGFGPILYADITVPTRTAILGESFATVEYVGNKVLTVSSGTENYKLFIESFDKADAMTQQVLGGGIECDEELKHLIGYATIVNSDGATPVTQELMEFFQKYAINQAMFMDGDGWAERADNPYQSTEDDQWLFACGYYE
ncbi:MAG: hypothetical protein J6B45_03860 [Clostridia bacterium]|nr:hypothetical protein [Clostridia bacterium]